MNKEECDKIAQTYLLIYTINTFKILKYDMN